MQVGIVKPAALKESRVVSPTPARHGIKTSGELDQARGVEVNCLSSSVSGRFILEEASFFPFSSRIRSAESFSFSPERVNLPKTIALAPICPAIQAAISESPRSNGEI